MIDMTDEVRDDKAAVCPYCGYRLPDTWELNHDQECHIMDCEKCGRKFLLSIQVKCEYITEKL